MDTEIFVFSRRDKDSSNINTITGHEHGTLETLGVLNTSVLISNCSIWVEGVTDRLYLRAFLKAFCESPSFKNMPPLEGFDYSFVEYAGNNLIHYCFDPKMSEVEDPLNAQIKAYFINSNIFLLADSDFDKEAKHKYYQEVADKRANFKYFKTEVPEIENILPMPVIQSWLVEKIKVDPKEIATVFKEEVGDQKLGTYLDGKFSYGKKKRQFSTKNGGGTLRSDYKSSLADFVHRQISEGEIKWDQLKESSIIERLMIELSDFINLKNSRKA